ncbi:metallophosphoesterase family protein [Phenylobacterium deserti]|uniref:Serine/threonine protein phosphatase n=1 Tax=Phenylobacterium deserti TaxID=1914756 RepID=A0A328A9U8_9CAUL|nr:metallophosphoesterase family protein [Phenylobacterium deserti]RAK50936.1 serine/threonine protein phosphatase [Phenylobacterium deserti]
MLSSLDVKPLDYTANPFGQGEQPTGRQVDGELVYAVGDIHGRYDLLKVMLAQLARDYAQRTAGRRPVLVFLGDYVDRGPQSPEVLDALIWLARRPDLEVRLLKGNHEQAMLDFIDDPVRAAPWLGFGGAQTLTAYGVEPPGEESGPQDLRQARDALLDRMPAAHLRRLQTLELMVAVGDYAFVHAGVRPGAALAAQDERDLLWIRRSFLESEGPHEKVIVHGHTWIDEKPQMHGHRLGLDTGAYATGVLTAVRLEDNRMAILQARAEAA